MLPTYCLNCSMFHALLFGLRWRCWCPSPDRDSDSPPPYVYEEISPLLARRWASNQSAELGPTLTQLDGTATSKMRAHSEMLRSLVHGSSRFAF
jgi:hypothetical protein